MILAGIVVLVLWWVYQRASMQAHVAHPELFQPARTFGPSYLVDVAGNAREYRRMLRGEPQEIDEIDFSQPWDTMEQLRTQQGLGSNPWIGEEEEERASTQSTNVFFKDGEPQTFEEYAGQPHILSYLQDAIRGMDADQEALEPQLFLGPAGVGKTLLAKVVAHELQLRAEREGLPIPTFMEVFPADLPDVAAFDEIMRRVVDSPGCVMFIDEIHDLAGPHTRKLYLVLEEKRYLFHGDQTPTVLPPVTLLAATTDAGLMHPALKRRWIRHQFERATEEELLGYVMRRPFPIEEAAARRIIDRTKLSGAPWEALEVYRMAVTSAKGRGAEAVADPDVDRVFDMQKLDAHGLRWMDRNVIAALFTQPKYRRNKEGDQELQCYAASEQNTALLAGVDREEFRQAIRPRLMARGYLVVRAPYGCALTPAAVDHYASLQNEAVEAV